MGLDSQPDTTAPAGKVDAGPLNRVVLAISAYQNDREVISLLEQVFGEGASPFQAVVVVDSLTSGAIPMEIERRRWPVRFHNADRNLGAAGNHAVRMKLAAEYDADWCYAVNADGEINLDTILELVRSGERNHKVGAVYPTRFRPNRGESWEPPRKTFLPLSPPLNTLRTIGDDEEVLWSSSNGALYNLAPPRDGIYMWDDLWMGWEDLAYSWLLWKNGWKQLQSGKAEFRDPYEHRAVRFLGKRLYIHDKAPWISYYTIRNLALFVRRTSAGPKGWLVVVWRFFQETALATLYKTEKAKRLRLLARGFIDGLRGRGGMVVAPEVRSSK